MDDVSIDMREVNELARDLDLRVLVVAAKAAVAVRAAASQTRDLAKRSAPRVTGELQGSIRSTGAGLTYMVRATARHAPFVEWGTSKMAPQPFLNPAADRGVDGLVRDLAKIAGDDL